MGAERSLWDIGVVLGLRLRAGFTEGCCREALARCPLMACVLFCTYIVLYSKVFLFWVQTSRTLQWEVWSFLWWELRLCLLKVVHFETHWWFHSVQRFLFCFVLSIHQPFQIIQSAALYTEPIFSHFRDGFRAPHISPSESESVLENENTSELHMGKSHSSYSSER